ncbi:MAG: YhcH/YjgK/YiaL family protein [Bacteroidetes bacterium]|nr:YhcH/YjgK/YiaL family protein [Bacteroidota bacterium]
MILDHLNNIDIYKDLSRIYCGLKFIAAATPEIELGTYEITDGVKALVTEYETVRVFERGYEAHKHVIDIQYPITGLEGVKWSSISGMKVNIPYDPVKDRTFFKDPSDQGTQVVVGNGIFAVMFPADGHSPQHFVNKPEIIKKITVKVSIK